MLVPLEYLDASLRGGIGPHVPDSDGVVHGVGEHVRPVRGQGEARHSVIVPSQFVESRVLTQLPNLLKIFFNNN